MSNMEQEAQQLLGILKRSSVTIDAKVAAFNQIKSNIKHLRVPDAAQATIFECIRIAISTTSSPTLSATAFSTLGHLIKRLSLQNQNNVIVSQAKKLLPILLERMGDQRESHRNAASANLGDFYPYASEMVENTIKEQALVGHNPRTKETAMMWVVRMHKSEEMPFKTYVPQLVACLEDADGMVRETAKSCVVELFLNAPDHAKTDLKKRMKMQEVRHTIVAQVTSQLDMRPATLDMSASTMSIQTMPDLSRNDSTFADSTMSEHPPAQDTVPMDPLYVSTARELEDIFTDMRTLFEGKETEHNWMARDKSITKLRRLTKGNAASDFHAPFVAGIRSVMDGITRISSSLRTTMSTNACQLVQELARALGPALDPVIEMVLSNFIKMSANTKQIAANNGSSTVEVVLSSVSYNKRMMEHMWFSCQEKNVQTRTFATVWLRTIFRKHGGHRAQIEHSGGLDLAEKCIKKGLGDANPKVREGTRAAFWAFYQVWHDAGDRIMQNLDPKSLGQLEKDPHNPNSNSLASSVSSTTTTTSKARPTATARPSVRDAIAAQRKAALAAKNMPERPSSAQAHFSPVKSTPGTSSMSSHTRPGAARSATARPPSALSREASSTTQASSQASAGSSLMAAPVRRPRRPEMARPATADPYAARRGGVSTRDQSTPNESPQTSPQKSARSTAKAPARTPGRAAAASTVRTKSRSEMNAEPTPRNAMAAATRKTPRRSTTGTTDSPLSSPSRGDDMTLVVPFTRPPDSDEVFGAPSQRGARQAPSAENSLIEDGENENDNFTMVLPQTFAHERTVRPGSSGRPGSSHRPSSSGSATHIPKPSTPRLSPRKGDTASPMGMSMSQSINRLRPENGRSPERHRSPLPGSVQNISAEAVASPGAVQVYEDPFTSESSNANTQEEEKPVLEELPIERANERLPAEEVQALSQSTRSNEQNIDTTQPRTPGSRHHKTTSTGSVITNGNGNAGSDNAETLRSRRLLISGIERIRAKTLDAHGFRRVQDIVKSSDEGVWGDNASKFGELLTVLLEYLEAPNDSLKVSGTGSAATKAQSLKGQVLATIRAMLSLWRREASAYYSRSLVSVLVSRRQWEESMHITADIEKTAEEIVRFCSPVEAMGKVLDLLEQLGAQPTSPASASSSSSAVSALDAAGAHRTASFALSTLGSLLSAASARGVPIDAALNKRLGACGVKYLQDPDSDVRKADLDFLLVMHEVSESDVEGVEKSRFWETLRGTGVKEGSVNLITYYIAKSRRGKGGA